MSGYSIRLAVWGKLLWVIPGCWLLMGCHFTVIPGGAGMERDRLKAAETAFFQKQYNRADREFQGLYDRSREPGLKNAALLGLICTEFMTAENRTAFQGAQVLLEKWEALDRQARHVGNPALMVPVLETLIRETGTESDRKAREMKQMARTHREEMEKMKSVRKKLEARIKRLNATMETLCHQISELEAIDQEFQKKRKPL